MSNEIEIKHTQDLMSALKNSLYPGATDQSCELVLSYCRAAGLDPLLKPVYIVPMYDSKTRTMKDTIMPGIGLYRIQADRTGKYVGLSEPEFGPDVTEVFPAETITKSWEGKESKKINPECTVTYPKYCKITVKKMVDGEICEYVAQEFWKENYATAGRDSNHPNEMWRKRPYAQLAKCAEAQALRKAFPDRVSSQPTAEEMEGKFTGIVVDSEESKGEKKSKVERVKNILQSEEAFTVPSEPEQEKSEIISQEQYEQIIGALKDATSGYSQVEKKELMKAGLSFFDVLSLRDIPSERYNEAMEWAHGFKARTGESNA